MNSMSKTGWSKESSSSIFSNEKKVKMKVDSSNRWSDLEWDEDIQYDKLSTEGWKSCKEERRGSKQFAHERHVTIFDFSSSFRNIRIWLTANRIFELNSKP